MTNEIIAIDREQSQAEQEPVAWQDGDGKPHLRYRDAVLDFEREPVPLYAAPQPAVDAETLAVWERGYRRYEAARKLNPSEWSRLYSRNLSGEDFDSMIDVLIPATQGATK